MPTSSPATLTIQRESTLRREPGSYIIYDPNEKNPGMAQKWVVEDTLPKDSVILQTREVNHKSD